MGREAPSCISFLYIHSRGILEPQGVCIYEEVLLSSEDQTLPYPTSSSFPTYKLQGMFECNLHPQTLSAWLCLGPSDPPPNSHPGSCSSSEEFPSG